MAGLTTIVLLSGILVLFSSYVNGAAISLEDLVSRRIRSRQVAFEARLEYKQGHLPLNTAIVFPKCTLNEGNGYNPLNGKFTAPIPGVYKFNAHICHLSGKYMVSAIMKGTVQLAVTSTFENVGSGCGSMNTIVRLKKGDVINVVAKWLGSHIWANEHRWNSFTGFLLYK